MIGTTREIISRTLSQFKKKIILSKMRAVFI
ncbi:hypothetical protein V7103_13030 [Neobacillus drentensis]